MFELSLGEIIVIATLALLFFGPHGCMDILKKLGQWLKRIQEAFHSPKD